jgi:hypothetical protein
MLAISLVAIVALNLVQVGNKKLTVGEGILLVLLIMILVILLGIIGLYLLENTTHMLMLFGSGGLPYILS